MRIRTSLSIAAVAAACLIAMLFLARNRQSKFVPTPLPAPNGYDDLVKAGPLMQKETRDFKLMTQPELQQMVEGNSNALRIARTGLSKRIQVPVTNSVNFLTAHSPELVQLRSLARGFAAESRLAELEGRMRDGAESSLDAIRLGIACPRGGVFVDALIGIAIESLGTESLRQFTSVLDAKSCSDIAQRLEELDSQRLTWDEVLGQEHYWSRETFPGFQYTIAELFASGQRRQNETKGKQKFIAQELNFRKLIIEFAARAYQLEKGHRPRNAADLVPEYLKTAPQDPSTGTNLTLP